MTKPMTLALHYFDLSNNSDMDAIEKLFSKQATYSSQKTGLYFGVSDIMIMQRTFHASFSQLHWQINSAEEHKPGICQFDFSFSATRKSGATIESSGLEYVICDEEKIHHIEIRNAATVGSQLSAPTHDL